MIEEVSSEGAPADFIFCLTCCPMGITRKRIPLIQCGGITCEDRHSISGVWGPDSFGFVCPLCRWWDSSEKTAAPDFSKRVVQ